MVVADVVASAEPPVVVEIRRVRTSGRGDPKLLRSVVSAERCFEAALAGFVSQGADPWQHLLCAEVHGGCAGVVTFPVRRLRSGLHDALIWSFRVAVASPDSVMPVAPTANLRPSVAVFNRTWAGLSLQRSSDLRSMLGGQGLPAACRQCSRGRLADHSQSLLLGHLSAFEFRADLGPGLSADGMPEFPATVVFHSSKYISDRSIKGG